MAKISHLAVGAAVVACAQFAMAQSAPGPSIESQPSDVRSALPAPIEQEPATSGGVAPPESARSSNMVVGTIIQTRPPTRTQSIGELSNDPYIQRREARAQARQEYRERVEAARREYRQDKRAADSLLYPQSGG